jgi:PAS domain S-box-containing protein
MSEPSDAGCGSQGPAFERYRRLVEASADLVTIVDSTGGITYANSAVETELGYDQGEVVGDSASEYCHPEDRAAVAGAFETVRGEPDEPETVEFRVERAEGSWCWVEATMQNMLDDDHVGGVAVTGREITERKEREQELQKRKKKYRNLFESTRDALMLLDRDGFFDCNQQTPDLFGIDSVEAFLEFTPWELSPPQQPGGRDSKEAALEHVETLVENYGGDVRVEDRAAQEPPAGPTSSDDEPTGAAFVVELPTVGSPTDR